MQVSKFVRWAARVLAAAATVIFVVSAVKDTLPDPLVLGVDEKLLFGSLALMLVGVLAAWKWEVLGGLATICGYGLLWYLEESTPERAFSFFPLAACLYLIAWMLEHKPTADMEPAKKTRPLKKRPGKQSAKS